VDVGQFDFSLLDGARLEANPSPFRKTLASAMNIFFARTL